MDRYRDLSFVLESRSNEMKPGVTTRHISLWSTVFRYFLDTYANLYIVTRIFTLIPTFPSHLASSHKKTPGLTLIVTINTTFGPLFAWQKIFFSLYIFPLSRISSTIFKRERERDTRIRKRRLSDLSVNSPLPVTRKCNSVFRYSACKSKMVCVSSRNPRRRADRYHEREKDTFLCVLFVYARNNRGKRIEEETDMFLERSCVLELTLRLAHGHLWARQRRENYACRKLIFLNVINNKIFEEFFFSIWFYPSMESSPWIFYNSERFWQNSRGSFIPWQKCEINCYARHESSPSTGNRPLWLGWNGEPRTARD